MTTCSVDKAWADAVAAVFPHEYHRMYAAVCKHPEPETLAKLLLDLANYKTQSLQNDIPTNHTKKRKLDVEPSSNGHANPADPIANPSIAFECKDVSFQMPSRKKLKLHLVSDASDARNAEVRLVHPQTNETEYSIPISQIDQVFCLPVPEKQQRQWNFCLVPATGAVANDSIPYEQVVFTMNETPPVSASITGSEDDTYVSITETQLNALLRSHGKRVIRPVEAEFASSIPQSHRKGEKAYHIKAHRGSKDGYLFLLPKGVLFGFKKPLSFFPFAAIDAISYTSVLQRTFNLVVAATSGEDSSGTAVETEFSMLDQADFAGIDEYVKRHGLNDASMAQERRAKAYNVNKVKKEVGGDGEGETGAEADDGQTELQKAEQLLQDQEDEEEEDYEASGGESDGEGESSEEEEGGDGGGVEGEEGEFDEDEEVGDEEDGDGQTE